jgi:maleylpyruvate isomerase
VSDVNDDSQPTPDDLVRAGVAEQTLALAADAARLRDADMSAPSALPGWTRGHVLAHVHLNAEAFLGVLTEAAAGRPGAMYPSREQRDAAIEAAATACVADRLAALLDSADRLAAAWAALPPAAHVVEFGSPAGWTRPVGEVAFLRWREVALHHADLRPPGPGGRDAVTILATGGPLTARLLAQTCAAFGARGDVPPLTVTATDLGSSQSPQTPQTWQIGTGGGTAVRGTAAGLAGWLTGRDDGAGLDADRPLPALPAWA